jgi:hypothetical protein
MGETPNCPEGTPGEEPLYKMAALSVGSRRLPGNVSAQCFVHRVYSVWDTTAHRTAARRVIPGSRLLATDRAAIL